MFDEDKGQEHLDSCNDDLKPLDCAPYNSILKKIH